MNWILPAALSFAVLLMFFEGLRQSGHLSIPRPWLVALGVAMTLCLGGFIWSQERYDCSPTPPFLNLNLEDFSPQERYETLLSMKNELSQKLAQCGASPGRWDLYLNLEVLVEDLKQQLKAELLDLS